MRRPGSLADVTNPPTFAQLPDDTSTDQSDETGTCQQLAHANPETTPSIPEPRPEEAAILAESEQ